MTTLRTAAQQALEALEQSETFVPYEGFGMARREAERKHQAAITALRAALAEPVQEPVAWTYEWKHRLHGGSLNVSRARWPESHLWIETPLYAAPPQRKPEPNSDYERGFVDGMSEQARRSVDKAVNAMTKCKPLAEEEIARLVTNDMVQFARAIERAHGIT